MHLNLMSTDKNLVLKSRKKEMLNLNMISLINMLAIVTKEILIKNITAENTEMNERG